MATQTSRRLNSPSSRPQSNRPCGSAPRRRLASAVVIIAVLLTAGTVQAQKAGGSKKVLHEDIVLTTPRPDGREIHITYYQSNSGKETPVVVLLHAEQSNRQVWLGNRGFAKRLSDQGYAVIAVDLRKHGQSAFEGDNVSNEISPADRRNMVYFDMEAVKAFIFKEHMAERLNMNKTAIIAPEMSGAVAMHFALNDWAKLPYDDGIRTPRGQDIRALILLSPERSPKGLSTGAALPAIGRMAANPLAAQQFSVLFLYGTKDTKNKRGEIQKMFKVASSNRAAKKRVLSFKYPYKYRGTELIGQNNSRTKCEEHMLGFLSDHLKKLTQTPWRDRRSRFDRN